MYGWNAMYCNFIRSAHQLQLRPKSMNHDLDLDISILMEKKFIHTYIHFNYFSAIRPCLLEIYRLTFVALIICCWLFSFRYQYQYIWCFLDSQSNIKLGIINFLERSSVSIVMEKYICERYKSYIWNIFKVKWQKRKSLKNMMLLEMLFEISITMGNLYFCH